MSELTNLTDRIAHLRDRKGSSTVTDSTHHRMPAPSNQPAAIRERRFATDTFMLFAYGLLVIALGAQLVLIVWLDII